MARMMSGREQHGGHEELAVACRRPVLGRYSWGRMGWKSNIVSQNAVKKKDRAPVPAASSEVGVLFRPAAASVMARGPAARCGSGLRLLRGRMVKSYGLTAGRAVSAAVGAIMTMIRCCPMASRARSFQRAGHRRGCRRYCHSCNNFNAATAASFNHWSQTCLRCF